jgi:hypothetical protein
VALGTTDPWESVPLAASGTILLNASVTGGFVSPDHYSRYHSGRSDVSQYAEQRIQQTIRMGPLILLPADA